MPLLALIAVLPAWAEASETGPAAETSETGPAAETSVSAEVPSGPWSLADCIAYALEHNLTVRQDSLTVLQRETELSTARGRRLPGVSASGSQNFSFGRGLTADNTYANTNTTSTSFSLGADMTLFNGFSINNNIKLSQLNLAAATADLEKARDDIRVAVAQAYVQILYDIEILKVAENQISVDSVQVARLEAMLRNGKASSAEVSAQKATMAQSELSRTQAQNNLNLALLDLTQLLELSSPEGFEVVAPNTDSLQTGILPRPEDIYADAVQTRPVIEVERIRLDYASRNVDLAKGSYLPSLSLNGGIGSNFYTSSGYESAAFADQLKNNFSQYIGLSLNVPLFNRMSTRNSVRSARLSYESQQLQLETASKALYKEIQQAYYNAVASESKYRSSLLAEQSAREAFETMCVKYESGKAGITDYNESKSRYMQASSDQVQARFEYLYQTKLLDFYRGAELDF